MNNISRKIFLSSLTSLTVMTSSIVFAEEMVTAPSFDGGMTASVGTFYVVPSTQNNEYLSINNADGKTTHTDIFKGLNTMIFVTPHKIVKTRCVN